jgi:16S rRNA (uracil1498-N3)-methyltransferase
MRTPRLFIDLSLSPNDTISLPKEKAHYISHVLRMTSGAVIKLFNNSGYEFDGIIVAITKKSAEIEINKAYKINNESPLKITLCLAIARGQHMDYSVQKAVELGVDRIIPVVSEFSNVKLQAERMQNKMTHWQNIIISASEQCGRNLLPQLLSPVSFRESLVLNTPKPRLILHPGSQQAMQSVKMEINQLSLMIGPEGGYSDTELSEAIGGEIIPVNLGPRILRAETAVVSALSNAQQLWGDLN